MKILNVVLISLFVVYLQACSDAAEDSAKTKSFNLTIEISGLQGSGLEISLNGTQKQTVSPDQTSITYPNLSNASSYDLQIDKYPGQPVQFCGLDKTKGTINGKDEVITLSCEAGYLLNVEVSGLTNPITLENTVNKNTLAFDSSGTKPFPIPLKNGETFEIGFLEKSITEICNFDVSSGTINSANQGIVIGCTKGYGVTVTVNNLYENGLVLKLNNFSDTLPVGASGDHRFADLVPDSTAYQVSVESHPPNQICEPSAGGTINNTEGTVTVNCFARSPTAYYSNGKNWNDYVENDGPDKFDASNTACTADLSKPRCLHGGEFRQIVIPGTNCDGIEIADQLSAFKWKCLVIQNNTIAVSFGLKDAINLSDLIDIGGTNNWKINEVSILKNSTPYLKTKPSVWFENTITVKNGNGDTSFTSPPSGPGMIFLLTIPQQTHITIGSDKVAVVIAPGVSISGQGLFAQLVSKAVIFADSKNYLWIEGKLLLNNDRYGVQTINLSTSMIRNLEVSSATANAFGIHDSSSNLSVFHNIKSHDIAAAFTLFSGERNILRNLTSYNVTGRGLEYTGRFSKVYNTVVANNATFAIGGRGNQIINTHAYNNSGINLHHPSSTLLKNILSTNNKSGVTLGDPLTSETQAETAGNLIYHATVANNSQSGFSIGLRHSASLNNIIANSVTINAYNGVYLSAAHDVIVSNVATTHNRQSGVWSPDNIFRGKLLIGNNTQDCRGIGNLTTNTGLIVAPDYSCLSDESNSLQIITTTNMKNSFDGPITNDDAINGTIQDGNGGVIYSDKISWTDFENPFRTWGYEDALYEKSVGGCSTTSTNCQIGDWRLTTNDPYLKNALPDFFVETAELNLTQAECDKTDGAIFEPLAGKCYYRFVSNATEIIGDEIGNDNGLCESGESCIRYSNLGYYQGHGRLLLENTIDVPPLTTITMYKYEFNGI